MLPVHFFQQRAIVAYVVDNCLGIPQHGAVYVPHLVVQPALRRQLVYVPVVQVGVFSRTLNVLADVQVAFAGILVPPLYERLVVGGLVSYLPVDLRHAVVHPSVVDPHQHVGVQVVVVLQAVGGTAYYRVALLVPVNAERRHAELDPGLYLVYRLMQLFHEHVDVVASPVAAVFNAIVVCLELFVVRDALSWSGVGVEVVVYV